ncbi:Asp-tRNA(Asn)/Glu-tRNA(Gln) amidotransferase subunit GatB [Rapidithrix thailandica]|uniref:Aspartyl/glutamyl-tRNA(Asn/Gln) amidotransferase subunit B n=1 Tax=Rapidithrix thailandica TaxID=413964 RepID=A0AAW9SFT3_9BACT
MPQSFSDKYEVVVGLEVHAQLLTQSKIFTSDATAFGQSPNTHISVITLGHPGTLPKINKKVAELAIRMGLACRCEISRYNVFDRKNYFYPDLPKGFQITQDKTPICLGGEVPVKLSSGETRTLRLHHIHLEEDAGKSLHLEGESETFVDLNRAGMPLIEIVTEPDIRSAEEAGLLLTELRKLVRYLDICDGNMEEGSMRCDANISVRLKGDTKLGEKVEVKNMNSIRNVQRAIEHEFERQVKLVEEGVEIISETRTFDANTGTTAGMRTKETLNDYRYFPEPDLPPLIITEEMLAQIKADMPALPQELFDKFTQEYQLPEYDASVLTDTKEMALYFEGVCQYSRNYKAIANWLMGSVKKVLNEQNSSLDALMLPAQRIAEIIQLVDDGKISASKASQNLFPKVLENPRMEVVKVAEQFDLIHEDKEDFIQPIIQEVLAKYPDKVKAYKNGKKNLVGMFMGEVMKLSKGKVDPKKANQLIREALESA